MLSSRNLLRQSLLVPMAVDGVLRITLSVSGPWTGFSCREKESVLGKVEVGAKESAEVKAVDTVSKALEMGLLEHSEGLILFGRTTGKL